MEKTTPMIDPNVNYIVSGLMRTGTSMMMKALEAGGMETYHEPEYTDKMKAEGKKDYYPEDYQLYECDPARLNHAFFLPQKRGKLIKCMGGSIIGQLSGNYKIIYMIRDPEECIKSHEAWFNNGTTARANDMGIYNIAYVQTIKQRRDMDCIVLNYQNVLEHADEVFKFIRDQGWPIDPEKAAKVVDKTMKRIYGDK